MAVTSYILIFLLALGASATQRICGFGFGIFIMMALPFLMPSFGEATALSGLLAILTALIPAVSLIKKVSWKKLIPILVTFIITSFFGVLLVKEMDNRTLKKVLGGVMILISLYFMFLNGNFRLKPTLPVQISMGTLSGLMGGLFAMQGPPAVIYFLGCTGRDKEEYMAISQWYFLIGNIMMTGARAYCGFVTQSVITCWGIGFSGVLIGLFIGKRVFNKIDPVRLRKIIYCFMAVSGLIAILS